MGGIWTGVIVAQIAATFSSPRWRMSCSVRPQASRPQAAFPAEEHLAVRLEMDRDGLTEERAVRSTSPFCGATKRPLESWSNELPRTPESQA